MTEISKTKVPLPGVQVKVSIKGLRRMDVRRGPMHNDRDLHGLAVTRS